MQILSKDQIKSFLLWLDIVKDDKEKTLEVIDAIYKMGKIDGQIEYMAFLIKHGSTR